MNLRIPFLRWLLLVAPALASVAGAKPWTFEFAPALLESQETNDAAPAARFKLGNQHTFYRGNFDGTLGAALDGTVMRHAADNPENLTAAVDGTATWLWEQDIGAPPLPGANTPSPSADIRWPSLLLRLHGTVRFESDQALRNTQVAIGPRASLASVNNTGWWWMIPSLFVGYHRIEVLESAQLRRLGEPERSFYRFDAYGSWKWKPFAAITRHPNLRPVGLHADLRYYRAFDLPTAAERASLDDAFYRAFDVSYDFTARNWRHLREVYLRVAHGRLPAATSDSRTISIGVVLVP